MFSPAGMARNGPFPGFDAWTAAAEILGQGRTGRIGEGAGMLRLRLEAGCGPGQPEGLQLCGVALAVLARQHEVAGIGDQNHPVQPPVATRPVAAGGEPGVVAGRLDLHHTRLGSLALFQLAILQLLRTEQSDVRMSWAAATVLPR